MKKRYLPCLIVALAFHLSLVAQPSDNFIQQADDLILNSQFAEALALLEKVGGELPNTILMNKKAETLTRMGDYVAAERILKNIQAQVSDQDLVEEAVTMTNLGYLQLNQGRHDLAEQSLRGALDRLQRAPRTTREQVSQTLSYLGLVYITQGKYTQAQDQLHRALSLRQELTRNREAWLAATYNDLGLAYSQTDKDRALDYYEQAHKTYTTLHGENDPRIAISNINTGIIYRDLELFGDAITNFENALKIWKSVYPQPHPAKAIALYNLGQTYLRLDDQKSAVVFYKQALDMYRACYGAKHPEISSVLNAMGNLEVAAGNFDQALLHYQEALKANIPDFDSDDVGQNPSAKSYYNGITLLHTLLFKAQALEARYMRKSLKFGDLRAALDVLISCYSLIDQLRQHSTNESDKLLLGVMANEVYADGVRIAYQAGLNAVRKESYFELAFHFAEKSKGAVLLESISDTDAKSFAGIPPALLEQEQQLKSALAVTARKLAEKPEVEEERSLRETAFNLKSEYESFIAKLERDYPAYFDLKFNVGVPAIAQLQTQLPAHTALLSYFIDEKNGQLYIFTVRKNHYKVWQRALPEDFDRYITGLRNGLYFQEVNAFRKSAYQLGRTLIPHLPGSITDLVIIPTGRLGLIPFESLLTQEAETTDYAALPYLLHRYGIRYELSAGLIKQKINRRPDPDDASIFLCAPVSFPKRPYLHELPGTEKEVQAISQLFASRNISYHMLTRSQAAETRVKTESLKRFKYLHFATHGIVDESRPELSRIFLMENEGDDGDLFAGEIYNLELDASLVTLSACQTGLGKLMKGEGVIGLSRALVYAGARNVMVSFWSVADESTAAMMTEFYADLLQHGNEAYSPALRRAKLKLLTDKKFAAPYYWAPFVLIGF